MCGIAPAVFSVVAPKNLTFTARLTYWTQGDKRRSYQRSRRVEYFDEVHCMRAGAMVGHSDRVTSLVASGRHTLVSQYNGIRSLCVDCSCLLVEETKEYYFANHNSLLS